jgi:hypothetical protein
MKIVDKDFKPKQSTPTYDKIQRCIDSLPFLEDDSHDFALIVISPNGYTTVGTNLTTGEAVFILEAAKLGLIMGDPEPDSNVH